MFQRNHLEIPKLSIPLPVYASDFIGDAWAVGDKFFDTVHKWMPFISKKRFFENLLNPLSQPRADVTILVFCMKLVIWLPSETTRGKDPRTSAYLFAKRTLLEAEVAGMLTLQLLQSWLLVTIYELGHAIYPSAYMSIATCARYGSLLDLKRDRSMIFRDSTTWIELEERRRTWWTAVVLDRFINLGSPERPMVAEEPELDDILPAKDDSWDQGVMELNHPLALSSPATTVLGRFAKLIQASHLLGKVLNHVAGQRLGGVFYDEVTAQLDRTLRSLIQVSRSGEFSEQIPFCAQINICYSALMILHDPVLNKRSHHSYVEKRIILKAIADKVVEDSRVFLARLQPTMRIESITPLLLHGAYQALATYGSLDPSSRSNEAEAFNVLEQKLIFVSLRWNAGDSYLRILEARRLWATDVL